MNKAKKRKLGLLVSNDHCIAFNENQNIPIWNYMLNEDKTKIFVYDEQDNTIYDGLVIDAPDSLFEYGECFEKISFSGINIPDDIVTRENFYLFENQFNAAEGGELECGQK